MSELNAPCRLCASPVCFLFSRQVLHIPNVSYFQCSRCELVQTSRPTWLELAYKESISRFDVGAVARVRSLVAPTASVIELLGEKRVRSFLDFGGGTGLFTRWMRDRGYDFHWTDPHTANVYARGFEATPGAKYDLVTSFEVWEHLEEVAQGIQAQFAFKPNALLVGTVLYKGIHPEWWYLTPETGQHIAFFSEKTMHFIAQQNGYRAIVTPALTLFVRQEKSLHALGQWWVRKVLADSKWATRTDWVLSRVAARTSLCASDVERLRTQRA